jgi:hypothetical protein
VIIAVDYDGTVVEQDGVAYSDVVTPPRLVPGAREGLQSLKRAGHILILWSARANRALLFNPAMAPLVRAGATRANFRRWELARRTHVERYRQMVEFAERELPGVFDAVDDGSCGKLEADLYIDDRAVRLGHGLGGSSWRDVAREYGAAA